MFHLQKVGPTELLVLKVAYTLREIDRSRCLHSSPLPIEEIAPRVHALGDHLDQKLQYENANNAPVQVVKGSHNSRIINIISLHTN